MRKASLKELKNDVKGRRLYILADCTDIYVQMMKSELTYLYKQADGQLVWSLDDSNVYLGVVNDGDPDIGRIGDY